MKRNLNEYFGKKRKYEEENIYKPLAEKMRPQTLQEIIARSY